MSRSISTVLVCISFLWVGGACTALAADDAKVTLADGKLQLTAPKSWERKEPRNRIIEHEFAAAKQNKDTVDGRITLMGAAGGVERNVERWLGQFRQPDGSATPANQTKRTVAGQTVHQVDLTGTFKDQRGPFSPATWRDDYRMLGAIIVTEKLGVYYVKMYGPKDTVAANVKAFDEFLATLKVVAADK